MNFLRNFLQGKEAPAHKGGGSSSYRDHNYLNVSKDDCFISNRSSVDSVSSSTTRFNNQWNIGTSANDQTFSITKESNTASLAEENKQSVIGDLNLSHEEKNYLERPSFKVEGVLSHHFHSEKGEGTESLANAHHQSSSFNDNKTLFFDCEEHLVLGDRKTCSPLADENNLFENNLLVENNCLSNKENGEISDSSLSVEPSAKSFGDEIHNYSLESSSVASCQSSLCHLEPITSVSDPLAKEDQSNYIELLFESPSKPLKPPPKRLGKRNQNSQKKTPKGKQQQVPKSQNCTSTAGEKALNSSPPKSIKKVEIHPVNSFDKSQHSKADCLSTSGEVLQLLVDTNDAVCKVESSGLVKDVEALEKQINISEESSETSKIVEERNIDQIYISEEASETKKVEERSIAAVATTTDFQPIFVKSDLDILCTNIPESSGEGIILPLEIDKVEVNNIDSVDDVQLNIEPNILDATPAGCADRLAKEEIQPLGNERNSISISCYGKEEFDILGCEANKLAEELTNTTDTFEVDSSNTEKRGSMDECANNFPSLSLEKGRTSSKRGKRDSLLQVSDSEAGPEIATGVTSSDLKCASEFFREAAELESQIRRNIASSVGSYAVFTSEGDRSSYTSESESYSSSHKAGLPLNSPPNEERSAPEGTSSPDPKSHEDSEVRSRLQRNVNYPTSPEVTELLKKQALDFEEKLLRQGIVAAEKEKELHEMLNEEQKHIQKVTASRDALLKLVEQYKGMLAALVSEKDKAGKEHDLKTKTLETDRQQAIEDLTNVEAAFSDVHRKYERTKQIVDTLRRNEETLLNAVADYEQKLLKQERKFIELQKHAEEKVKLANDEFESLRRVNDQEMTKMGALLKKAEMKIISLQEALDRKTRENHELTQLCDDLISKVGS